MTRASDEQTATNAPALPACPHCKTIIAVHQKLRSGHCGSLDCQTAHLVRVNEDKEQARADEYAERQAAAATGAQAQVAEAARVLGADPDDMRVAVVPYQNAPLSPLPVEAHDAFAAHIHKITAAAFKVDPGDPEADFSAQPESAAHPIVTAACTACQGQCCARGGGDKHAFLTRKSVLAVRARDPDMDAQAVALHYLDALPTVSVQGACVYQGPQGCVLSRDWRAAICNAFHCHDLHALHGLTEGRSDVPLAIVGMDGDRPAKVVAFEARHGLTEI